MTPLEQDDDLLKYIPQRPPFVMVSELYSHSNKEVRSGFRVMEDNVLVENGQLQEAGLVENMAQTTALLAGIQAYTMKQPAPVGFIAAIKNLKISRLPKTGEAIFTTVKMTNEVMNMQIAQATVNDKSQQLIASCEMRIFIQPKESNG